MKCHKINGIEKSVCTAEQKIAYNFAFMWCDVGKKLFNSDNAEVVKSDALQVIVNNVIQELQSDKFKRFNIDAIIVAFRQGFRNYCTENYFIANDYETIGKYFSIPYVIE